MIARIEFDFQVILLSIIAMFASPFGVALADYMKKAIHRLEDTGKRTRSASSKRRKENKQKDN